VQLEPARTRAPIDTASAVVVAQRARDGLSGSHAIVLLAARRTQRPRLGSPQNNHVVRFAILDRGGVMITFTRFPRKDIAHGGTLHPMSSAELAERMRNAEPGPSSKYDLPLMCVATFQNNYRAKPNVVSVDALGLDLDTPTNDPAALAGKVCAALGGVECFAHASYSSEPGAVKLRVFVPYASPVSGPQHEEGWRLVDSILCATGIEIDPKCKDASRGYFQWAIPPNGYYWSAHIKGPRWLAKEAAEAWSEVERAQQEAQGRKAPPPCVTGDVGSRVRRAIAYVKKCDAAIAGSHGHSAAFETALKLFSRFGLDESAVLDIMREYYNPSCVPPFSERDLARKVSQAARSCGAKA